LVAILSYLAIYKSSINVQTSRMNENKINRNKPECVYGSTEYKCSISSKTIKYRCKFKSNQIFFSKMLVWTPSRCVPSLESLAQVLVKHQISSQTIKYRYKFKSNQKNLLPKNASMDPLKVCTKFQVSRTSVSQKNLTKRRSSSRSRSSSSSRT